MEYSLCNFCGWPTNLNEVSTEVEILKAENANLKREIDQLETFHSKLVKFLVSPSVAQPSSSSMMRSVSLILKLSNIVNAAMSELVMLGQFDCPFWKNNSGSNRESLNYEEYKSVFNNGIKPPGCVIESSKDTGLVRMTSYDLVKTLMNMNKWVDVFGTIVPLATPRRVRTNGPGGAINGSLLLIQAEFIVPSPLVPKRHVTFLRYCKLLRNGVWAVLDVSPNQPNPSLLSFGDTTRLLSGLIIEDMGNGYSMVTWIEQTAYDESQIHQLYRPLIGSGIGLGAKRWLKTLQRHCQILSFMWTINLAEEYSEMPAKVRAEIVKLAQRMTLSYSLGLTDYAASKWESIQVGNARGNMKLMIRKNMNETREMTGMLSAATSVWFPVNQQKMFDYLSNHNFRNQWEVLTHNTFIEVKVRIQIANHHGNFVSLLQIAGKDMLVLQELRNYASGAFVVYAPMGTNSLDEVRKGADLGFVQILPSGFSILPDREACGGCLLTFGLQVLVSSKPTSELSPS